MGASIHAVHLALLLLGAAGITVLLRPAGADRAGQPRDVRALRRAARSGSIVERAERRARGDVVRRAADERALQRLTVHRRTGVRTINAIALAVAAVVVELAANHLAGGQVPRDAVVLAVTAGVAVLAAFALDRPRAWHQVVAAAMLTQAAVHVAFSAPAALAAYRDGSSVGDALAALLVCHPAAGPSVAGSAQPAWSPGTAMLLISGMLLITTLACAVNGVGVAEARLPSRARPHTA